MAEAFADRAALALEQARLVDELREARDDAEAASRAKSDFLATISHEFRTPLTAVLGYAELLVEGVPERIPERSLGYVQRLKASAEHQLALVDQILVCARLDAGQEHPRMVDLDVREVLSAVVDLLRLDAEVREVDLTLELPDEAVRVHSDGHMLRQVFVNLVANAIRFSEKGEVRITLEQDAAAVETTVRDTGIGMSAEQVAHVFDRFWQAEQGETRRFGGTGIGLTVVKQLLELLGGGVRVSSEPGVGSAFTVRLPRFPAALDQRR